MTAKIIKLDDYLEEYRSNITKSVAQMLDIDVEKINLLIIEAAENKFAGDINEVQSNLIVALKDNDNEAVIDILYVQESIDEPFNGVDIAEGYNFRCELTNEMAKTQFMDWLEESGVDYLIDNDGRFAIKCPTRNNHYHVSRKVEHFSNKWDRGPIQKTVDPSVRVKGLTDIVRNNGLYDTVTEIAGSHPVYSPGTGKAAGTGGPSMFPADKKKKHRYLDDPNDRVRENTELPDNEDSVRTIMQKNPGLSDNVRIIPDPSTEYVWLVADDAQQEAWIVYIKEEDVENVDYIEAVSKYFDKPNQTTWEGVSEGKKKKSPGQQEKEAKKKADNADPVGKGVGAMGLIKNKQKAGPQTTKKGKKGYDKRENRKKIDIDESSQIEEGVLGMTNLPTVARMQELAGLEITATPESTTTVEIVPVENVSCEENALGLAMNRLDDVFKIYDIMNCEQKEEFKLRLINLLMKGRGHLREGDELLKELERPEQLGQLSSRDRIQLAKILRKYWRGMAIDVDNWKHKTTKLAPLEQVIILLRKLEKRIGQGMT